MTIFDRFAILPFDSNLEKPYRLLNLQTGDSNTRLDDPAPIPASCIFASHRLYRSVDVGPWPFMTSIPDFTAGLPHTVMWLALETFAKPVPFPRMT